MKIILGFLIISFACLTFATDDEDDEKKAWSPNKENCEYEIIEANVPNVCSCKVLRKTVTEGKNENSIKEEKKWDDPIVIQNVSSFGKCKSECWSRVPASLKNQGGDQDPSLFNVTFEPNEKKRDQFKEDCDRWRADTKTIEEQKREEAEKTAENDRNILKDSQEQCNNYHRDFQRSKSDMQARVREITEEIAGKQHEILEIDSKTSVEEDREMDRYADLKDRTRRMLNNYEGQRQTETQKLDNEFRDIQKNIEIMLIRLEQTDAGKRHFCSERYNKYKGEEDKCYRDALEEVSRERNHYYQNLYSGEQEFGSVSEVFASDFETTEKRFMGLLNIKKQRCYDQVIGKTEIVACDLATLEKRDELCQKEKKPQCPTPKATEIELELKKSLQAVHADKKGFNVELKVLYQKLEEFPTKRKEALALLAQRLEDEKKAFDEKVAQRAREHQQAQVDRFNRKRRLQDEILLLRQEDPSQHFQSEWNHVYSVCCQPLTSESHLLNTLTETFNKEGKKGLNLALLNLTNNQQQTVGGEQLCNDLIRTANDPQFLQTLFVTRGQIPVMSGPVPAAQSTGAR